MSAFITRHSRSLIVGLSCAGLATGAGAIATAGAATGHVARATAGRAAGPHQAGPQQAGPQQGPPPLVGLAGQAIHGQFVVPTKTGFTTATFDRGLVKSVDGQQLQITEGTKANTYQTVTVTVPAGAVVRNDGSKATLAQITTGEHVTVVQGPQTCVLAGTRAPGAQQGPGQGGPVGNHRG